MVRIVDFMETPELLVMISKYPCFYNNYTQDSEDIRLKYKETQWSLFPKTQCRRLMAHLFLASQAPIIIADCEVNSQSVIKNTP